MTPAVIESPIFSVSAVKSSDGCCDLCEYLEEREPLALLEALGTSRIDPPSSCPSCDLSLCIFLPKNDLPPEDCRDLLSAAVFVEGICD